MIHLATTTVAVRSLQRQKQQDGDGCGIAHTQAGVPMIHHIIISCIVQTRTQEYLACDVDFLLAIMK